MVEVLEKLFMHAKQVMSKMGHFAIHYAKMGTMEWDLFAGNTVQVVSLILVSTA